MFRGYPQGQPLYRRALHKYNVFETPLTQEYYKDFGALNLGMGGDQTQHLLWRLQNGELPDVLQPEVKNFRRRWLIFKSWVSHL